MFEIWKVERRSRLLVARFRMRHDAVRYLKAFGDEGATLEMVEPHESAAPPSHAPISMRRGSANPPPSQPRRRSSGVVVASEHPDEFIADKANGGD